MIHNPCSRAGLFAAIAVVANYLVVMSLLPAAMLLAQVRLVSPVSIRRGVCVCVCVCVGTSDSKPLPRLNSSTSEQRTPAPRLVR